MKGSDLGGLLFFDRIWSCFIYFGKDGMEFRFCFIIVGRGEVVVFFRGK